MGARRGGAPNGGRAAEAERLLRERGIPEATVTAAGIRGEIAAVRAPAEAVARLAELVPAVKALGFRFVALDLDSLEERRV